MELASPDHFTLCVLGVTDAVFKSPRVRKWGQFFTLALSFHTVSELLCQAPNRCLRTTFGSLTHCWPQPPSLPLSASPVVKVLKVCTLRLVQGSSSFLQVDQPHSGYHTFLLIIRVIEWSTGKGHQGIMSSGHPSVQENPICTAHDQAPTHQAPCFPLGTCLPAGKCSSILIQICLFALFPH